MVSTYPSEKYEFVSWDDEIPNIWKVLKKAPNHQPGIENVLKYLKRRDHESPQVIMMIIYHKISKNVMSSRNAPIDHVTVQPKELKTLPASDHIWEPAKTCKRKKTKKNMSGN